MQPLAYARLQEDADDLILLPLEILEAVAESRAVLRESKTFRDYVTRREAASPSVRELLWWWEEEFEDVDWIELDDDFDVELLPGFIDGLFPVDLRTLMLDNLDEEITELIERCITIDDHLGGTPKMLVAWSERDEVVSALRAAGYEVVDRQDLVDGP